VNELQEWLIAGPPWVEYHTRLDLLNQSEDDSEVSSARQRMMSHPQVTGILDDLARWPGPILTSHKSAGHTLHQLAFIADLGFRQSDPRVDNIIKRIIDHQSAEGPFQILMNIHPRYGGSGKDEFAWALCDSPTILYALAKFGLGDNPSVQAAVEPLAGLVRENGWPCAVSPELGKFRGPGRVDDPCPYANLVMLKALAQFEAWRDSAATRMGVEAALTLWQDRANRHPYMFYMGTDFCKIKAPMIWYDIVHVMDVLTHFPWAVEDPRLHEMAEIVRAKVDTAQRYTPESVWRAWKGWSFGQKKEPSRWLTFVIRRALSRI
jgi:hypothetical protein